MDSDAGECHRRDCQEDAVFLVRERYLEETGQGHVEASARLCRHHTREERPTNLEPMTPKYRFEVTALASEGEDA